MMHGLWTSITSSKKVIGGVAHEYTKDLVYLKELMEEGKLKVVIDKSYPLEQIVEAHHHMDTGRTRGNIVITI